MAPIGLVSGEILLSGLYTVTSCGGRDNGALSGCSCEGTTPIHEGSTLMTESPPKGPAS